MSAKGCKYLCQVLEDNHTIRELVNTSFLLNASHFSLAGLKLVLRNVCIIKVAFTLSL